MEMVPGPHAANYDDLNYKGFLENVRFVELSLLDFVAIKGKDMPFNRVCRPNTMLRC